MILNTLFLPGTSIAGAEVGFNYKELSVAAVLWCRVLLGAFIAFCMEVRGFRLNGFTVL